MSVNPSLTLTRLFGDATSELSPETRAERRALLLARLAQRAATWGWREVYEKIRAGEHVSAFHRGMTALTLRRRSGLRRPPPDYETHEEIP